MLGIAATDVPEVSALDVDAVTVAVEEIAAACAWAVPPEYAAISHWVGDISEKFPNDVGVVLALHRHGKARGLLSPTTHVHEEVIGGAVNH